MLVRCLRSSSFAANDPVFRPRVAGSFEKQPIPVRTVLFGSVQAASRRTVRSYLLAQRFSSANVSQKRRVTHPTMLFTHPCKTDRIAAQRRDHVIFTSLTPPLPKTATRQALLRHSRIVAALSWPLRSLPHVVSLRAGGRGRRECDYHQPAEKRVRRKKHR